MTSAPEQPSSEQHVVEEPSPEQPVAEQHEQWHELNLAIANLIRVASPEQRDRLATILQMT